MIAYGVENGSWEWDGEHYDARILIYDNRNPYANTAPETKKMVTEQTQLYYNTETYAWTIPFNQMTEQNGALGCMIWDVDILNAKGLLEGTTYTAPEWTDVILSNALTSPYQVTGTSASDVKEYPFCFMTAEDDQCQNFINEGESTPYTLTVENAQPLLCSAYYQNALLLGKTADGTEVQFDPAGSVSVVGNTSDYQIRLLFNEDYVTDWYYIDVNGSAGNASLAMQENGYLLTADDLTYAEIKAGDRSETQTLTISTDADTILIYETAEHTLAAAVDQDGDGSYETQLSAVERNALGDLNSDGEANASDAAQILIAAAKIGAGSASGLTPAQEQAADVDGNGEINAADAALILMYAAEAGSGNFSGTLEDYMEVRS